MNRIQHLTAGLLATVALSVAGTAAAQSFPNRPIKIVVTSPAGGGNDFIVRTIAQKMEVTLKQPVVVDNKPGASGIIAADFVAKSPADGYTILFSGPLIVQTAALYAKLPYDPLKDFTPLTDVIRTPLWLAVNTEKLPVKNVKEFVDYAKANPGKISYGSVGSGSSHHLIGYLLGNTAGVELLHVPYKGGAPAMVALISGEVNAAFADYVSLKPHVASGKVRLLGVTGTKRPALTPDVPTFTELGFKGFESYGWGALFLPAKAPADVVQKLHAAVATALKEPDVAAKFSEVGFELGGTPQVEFVKTLQADYTRWTTLIKQVGVKLD
jgi:tripartite-type tricarboxylate transporter receptor subunit TctC